MPSQSTQFHHGLGRAVIRATLLTSVFTWGCNTESPAVNATVQPEIESAALRQPDYTQSELEELAASAEVQAALEPFHDAPPPDESRYVEMSDGVRLAVSLYYPPGLDPEAGSAPVAYVETWYTRAVEARGTAIEHYLAAGFVVAIADPRGFGASFGTLDGVLSEAQRSDQKEMIAWLSEQPWSNGKVAAVGISVSAMHAEAMADSGAPALRAAIIRETEFDQYADNLFVGGVPNGRMHNLISDVLMWMRGDACVEDLALCAYLGLGFVDEDTDQRLLQAALRDHQGNIDPALFGEVIYSDDILGSGTFGDASPIGNIAALQRAAVPARVSASWVDGATAQGALARFNALPNVPMELSIGVTTHLGGLHADPFTREAFTVTRPNADDQFVADTEFVQRVLDGEPIGRSIRYYVLGADAWKTTSQWPPAGVTARKLHFSRTRLQAHAHGPTREQSYTVDPTTTSGVFNRWASQSNAPIYYGDRRLTPGRRLSFDADAVHTDMELAGAPELCLALRSDQTDGLVIAYLEDVAPDGRVTYLTEGELRLLHRKTASGGCDSAPGTERSFSREDGAAVTPGELMHVELTLLPVAARIRKGHRLRISLAGADAGNFSTLTETPATWSVAYGGRNGSTLSLPLRRWTNRDGH
jgi:putative CocE/NonD family hydrolase